MHIDLSKKHPINATTSALDEDELKDLLEDALDSDLCKDIVDEAFGYAGRFQDDYFEDIGVFCELYENADDPLELAIRFWEGDDLDSDENHANPKREYARYSSSGNIETTDYPGDVYYEELLKEIVEFIMDNLDYPNYPDEIQEIIDMYLDTNDTDEDEE